MTEEDGDTGCLLRNKDGVTKMIADNGLVSLISSVEYKDSCYFSKLGF
jgi:hypothetical protein